MYRIKKRLQVTVHGSEQLRLQIKRDRRKMILFMLLFMAILLYFTKIYKVFPMLFFTNNDGFGIM